MSRYDFLKQLLDKLPHYDDSWSDYSKETWWRVFDTILTYAQQEIE